MLVGVVSAAAFGTNENPVIAPPALRLTSAVTCCHQGLLADCNALTSLHDHDGRTVEAELMSAGVRTTVLSREAA